MTLLEGCASLFPLQHSSVDSATGTQPVTSSPSGGGSATDAPPLPQGNQSATNVSHQVLAEKIPSIQPVFHEPVSSFDAADPEERIHPEKLLRTEITEDGRPEEQKLSTAHFFLHRIHGSEISCLDVSDDGTGVFTGHRDGVVIYSKLIDTLPFDRSSTGNEKRKSKAYLLSEPILRASGPIFALALSPDNTRLAVSLESHIVIVNVETRKIENEFTRIPGKITALSWDPRGELLAFGLATGEVYVWNLTWGDDAGRDSLRAIESYLGGNSPIVRLVFHPSARSLFVAESDGTLYLWRLLRTERELGIRDAHALYDRKTVARWRVIFSQVAPGIRDMFLSVDGSELIVAAGDGGIYRWKVRGLRQISGIQAQKSAVFAVRELALSNQPSQQSYVFVSSGRAGIVRFWCSTSQAAEVGEQTDLTPESGTEKEDEKEKEEAEQEEEQVSKEELDEKISTSSTASADILGETADVNLPTIGGNGPAALLLSPVDKPVFELDELQEPLTLLETGKNSTILWAAGKTGNLLAFDSTTLSQTPFLALLHSQCDK